MDEKIVKQNIDKLKISNDSIKILKSNNIKTIGKLCKCTKSDLKDIQLVQKQINKIEIELQLLGLNLKNNL